MVVDKVTYYEGPTYKGVRNGIVDIADTREREKKKKKKNRKLGSQTISEHGRTM